MRSLKGHLLLATPELLAPIFNRSVILMLDHSCEGAAGVVINRLTDSTVASIAEQVFEEPNPWEKLINLGGPVPGPMVVLHTMEEFSDQEILAGVYSTVDASKVRELLRIQVEPSLTLANYSGWSPGQLEGEIAEGSWITVPARSDLVFWEGDDDLWKFVTKEYHGRRLTDLLRIREMPADPRAN